ncbi:rhotekin-like isoform X2 [Eucyclogobius newberryi]|uniref:rhotekin-like isoform X2 n=1 Tax=Eucyclogobius newberryi TaxID=166745 RepID=UPI003B5CC5B6
MEMRMRDGANKLLAACSQREQALEASKNLVRCSSRILALLSQLQKMRRAQVLQRVGHSSSLSDDLVPCFGKLAISDLRIPLMWKDSEYFKNKGELHRCAVFCLLQCDSQILTSDLQLVDRTLTDICFEDTFIFSEVGPGFLLRVELYSSCAAEEGSLGSRRGSFGVTAMGNFSGKKLRAALESASACASNPHGKRAAPVTSGTFSLEPKFNLLAHVTLKLKHIHNGFKTHDLSLAATEESSFWLPLYGNICCRLVAQPQCMLTPALCGQLKVKGRDCWENVYGVLKGTSLVCYCSEEGQKNCPLHIIPIRKDALICVSEQNLGRPQSIHIRSKTDAEDVVYTVTADDTQHWTKALWQHLYNMGQWQQCCTELMKLEVSLAPTSFAVQQGSLFHEIVTPPAPKEGSAMSDLSAEMNNLLASYYKKSG